MIFSIFLFPHAKKIKNRIKAHSIENATLIITSNKYDSMYFVAVFFVAKLNSFFQIEIGTNNLMINALSSTGVYFYNHTHVYPMHYKVILCTKAKQIGKASNKIIIPYTQSLTRHIDNPRKKTIYKATLQLKYSTWTSRNKILYLFFQVFGHYLV